MKIVLCAIHGQPKSYQKFYYLQTHTQIWSFKLQKCSGSYICDGECLDVII